MPILCSIDPHDTALRAPSDPSSLTRNLGTTNSEMPLRAVRRARRLGQHQVDDVVGQVVLARRDEDLGAGDRVDCRPPAARRGCGSGPGRCRTAARSGSSSRPIRPTPSWAGTSPAARASPWRPARRSRRGRGPGYIANAMLEEIMIFLERGRDDVRHPLPAERLGRRQRAPAALDELRIGLLEARRASSRCRRRGACSPAGRPTWLSGNSTSATNRPPSSSTASTTSGVAFGEAGQVGVAVEPDDMLEHEARVADGGRVLRHGSVLRVWSSPASSTATNSLSSAMAASMSCFWRSSARSRSRQRASVTCALHPPPVADVVEVDHLADLGQREADALAAQDPRQPRAVAVRIDAAACPRRSGAISPSSS